MYNSFSVVIQSRVCVFLFIEIEYLISADLAAACLYVVGIVHVGRISRDDHLIDSVAVDISRGNASLMNKLILLLCHASAA